MERIAILGDPGRSTYYQWMKKAREDQPLTLPLDTLLRISAVLGIYRALTILFEDEAQAMIWLKGPPRGTLFSGASPMDYMLEGGHDGLISVRRYLDGWLGGNMGFSAPEGSFETVIELIGR
nr:MbcA/ParS/Xre antitoxin family protein [Amylibacter sp.]